LTAATIEELFCDHYRLHEHSRLGQPALYEVGETVTLIGPRGHLDHVRVIGPPRTENQVEISSTDAQILGISAPARRSGEIVETPGIVIKGPRTSVRLHHGVIRALRHLHMNPADAEYAGVQDGDLIEAVIRAHRPLIRFRGVLIRVSPEFRLELHLDSDEANALGLKSGDQIELRPRARRGRRK
jgi:propanediol utilization protein